MLNVAAIQIIIWGFLCCLPVGPFIFCKSKLCVISASLLLLFRVSCWLAISDRSISYNHEACCKKAVQGLMLHKNTLLKIHFTGFSEFPYFWILRLPKSCCIVANVFSMSLLHAHHWFYVNEKCLFHVQSLPRSTESSTLILNLLQDPLLIQPLTFLIVTVTLLLVL